MQIIQKKGMNIFEKLTYVNIKYMHFYLYKSK